MRLTLAISNDHGLPPDLETTIAIEQGAITIGRAADNDWVLPDPERIVSNRHCTVQYRDGEYVIIDTSTNGVFINHAEERIEREKAVELHDGDYLTLGTYEVLVEIDAAEGYEAGAPTAVGAVTDVLPIADQIADPSQVASSGKSWDDLPLTTPTFGKETDDSDGSPEFSRGSDHNASQDDESGMTELDVPIRYGEVDAVGAESAAEENEVSLFDKYHRAPGPETEHEPEAMETVHEDDDTGELKDSGDLAEESDLDVRFEEDATAMDTQAEPPDVQEQPIGSEEQPLAEEEPAPSQAAPATPSVESVIPEDWWLEENPQEVEPSPAFPEILPTQQPTNLDLVPYLRQQQHYLKTFIIDRCRYLHAYDWGIEKLILDEAALQRGEVAIVSAKGLLPDGTPFDIPHIDEPPEPLQIGGETSNVRVILVAPKPDGDESESDRNDFLSAVASAAAPAAPADAIQDDPLTALVHRPRLRLMLDSKTESDELSLAIARVLEVRVDQVVMLDETYLPPARNCLGVPTLRGYMDEIRNLLRQRGDVLADELGVGSMDKIDLSQLLSLSVVNRYEACFDHWLGVEVIHPADLYQSALQLSAEMATFSIGARRRPRVYAAYDHSDLANTFAPVLTELRRCLRIDQPKPVPIPLKARGYGISVAPLGDPERRLLGARQFILAVTAVTSEDTHGLEKHFPERVAVGPVEKIAHLVNQQRRGIEVYTLATAPSEYGLTEQANTVYFKLDADSELWSQLSTSKGLALHIAEEFLAGDAKLQLWAVAA